MSTSRKKARGRPVRRACDEDCLRRIAGRLCALDALSDARRCERAGGQVSLDLASGEGGAGCRSQQGGEDLASGGGERGGCCGGTATAAVVDVGQASEEGGDACGSGCCDALATANGPSAKKIESACGSGCCDATTAGQSSVTTTKASGGGCCKGGTTDASQSSTKGEEPCGGGCCDATTTVVQALAKKVEDACGSGCCDTASTAGQASKKAEETCDGGCCDASTTVDEPSAKKTEEPCSRGCCYTAFTIGRSSAKGEKAEKVCGGGYYDATTTAVEASAKKTKEPCGSGCCDTASTVGQVSEKATNTVRQSGDDSTEGQSEKCSTRSGPGCCTSKIPKGNDRSNDCRKGASNAVNGNAVDFGTDGCCPMKPEDESSRASSCCDATASGDEKKADGYEVTCCEVTEQESEDPLSACSEHLKIAFARFESLIRKSQCLCRKVVEELGFCCCSGGDGGCADHAQNIDEKATQQAAFLKHELSELQREVINSSPTKDVSHAVVDTTAGDIESAAARDHVVLTVSGMTCTGCSRKLMNVLNDIPGLHNPKVTFISGTASFELDSAAAKAEEVLPLVEKRTGFKVKTVVDDYQVLEVLLQFREAQELERCRPDGLVSVEKVKGEAGYQVTYDPRIIGARDLLPPDSRLAPPKADSALTEGKRRLVSMSWATVTAAAFTIPVVVLNWSSNPVPQQTRDIVSLALATVVQAIAVPEFYVGAMKSLIFSRVLEMDMLVVISITAAYVYSIVAFGLTESGIQLEQKAFFETSSLLITLVLVGRLMAAIARLRAVSAVSLHSLQAETAILVLPDGRTQELDARLLQFGDTIQVLPHSRIVTDGTVTQGSSAVDESMLTGESAAVNKEKGDVVVAGTMNGTSALSIRITRLPGANSVSDIASLVEKALGAKPRVQDLADKVASWFIPVVLTISLLVFVIWIAVSIAVNGRNGGGAVGIAVTYGITVLAISCPCALGLAVPMVLVIAGGVAARGGVVIKSADALERGYKATDAVFDKTGTLTEPDLRVVHKEVYPSPSVSEEDALALAMSMVKDNSHPVSVAVRQHLQALTVAPIELNSIESIPGSGLQATWNDAKIKAGNPYWLATHADPAIADMLSAGMTVLSLTYNSTPFLAFGLKSTTRPEAASVISALQTRKIRCHIVSGDADPAVQAVATAVGIDPLNIASRQSPADKVAYITALQANGATVLFCGDGTNDAAAVAQANIGIQIGSVSDLTSGVSDVTLLGGLDGLLVLLQISHRAFRRIAFNFAWSAVYNTFAILLAAGAFVEFRIPPAYAGLGEIVSVAPVVVAAVSLAWGNRGLI